MCASVIAVVRGELCRVRVRCAARKPARSRWRSAWKRKVELEKSPTMAAFQVRRALLRSPLLRRPNSIIVCDIAQHNRHRHLHHPYSPTSASPSPRPTCNRWLQLVPTVTAGTFRHIFCRPGRARSAYLPRPRCRRAERRGLCNVGNRAAGGEQCRSSPASSRWPRQLLGEIWRAARRARRLGALSDGHLRAARDRRARE